ncbi:hypothetical protein DPSP01_014736 [Paraphaeosphaeria sporulosa]
MPKRFVSFHIQSFSACAADISPSNLLLAIDVPNMRMFLGLFIGISHGYLEHQLPLPGTPSPNFGHEELWRLQNDFWARFLYPANVEEARSVNSTIFSDNVQGRVSDSRTFDGAELNTEYIFGLFTPSSTFSLFGQPTSYEILHFAANQNIASSTTRVDFSIASFHNTSVPVLIDTWMTWDEKSGSISMM